MSVCLFVYHTLQGKFIQSAARTECTEKGPQVTPADGAGRRACILFRPHTVPAGGQMRMRRHYGPKGLWAHGPIKYNYMQSAGGTANNTHVLYSSRWAPLANNLAPLGMCVAPPCALHKIILCSTLIIGNRKQTGHTLHTT